MLFYTRKYIMIELEIAKNKIDRPLKTIQSLYTIHRSSSNHSRFLNFVFQYGHDIQGPLDVVSMKSGSRSQILSLVFSTTLEIVW